jgi:hypothetical protein
VFPFILVRIKNEKKIAHSSTGSSKVFWRAKHQMQEMQITKIRDGLMSLSA